MKDISFFSDNAYVSIPNSENPKVILAVDKSAFAKRSFKLYNPFSFKAKMFKKVVTFLSVNFNAFFVKMIELERYENSEFINFLNQELNKKFVSSVYYATLKDKVVIQLQTEKKVFGYVKFPLNDIGLINVKNEINALEILSKNGVLNLNMKNFEFKGIPFFLLPELKGDIKNIDDSQVLKILESFKKENTLPLSEHKRVEGIKRFLVEKKLSKLLYILEDILRTSDNFYHEVYEHGDFAPWNIIKTNKGYTAFDFEYFTEKGLEYFDLIKYHFQVGRLLQAKNKKELYVYINKKINIKEIKEILSLYLLKEIMVSMQQEKECDFEEEMLNYING